MICAVIKSIYGALKRILMKSSASVKNPPNTELSSFLDIQIISKQQFLLSSSSFSSISCSCSFSLICSCTFEQPKTLGCFYKNDAPDSATLFCSVDL